LAGQAGSYFGIVLSAIVRCTGAAKSTETTGPADHVLSRIPEGLDDGDSLRHLILLAGNLHRHHLGMEDFFLIDDVFFVDLRHNEIQLTAFSRQLSASERSI